MPLAQELNPIECKNVIQNFNETDIPQLNQLSFNGSFTFLDRLSFQVQIDKKQTAFTVGKFTTAHNGEDLNRNTGNQNPTVRVQKSAFTQSSPLSQLVFHSVNIKNYFPPLNGSNCFLTVQYDDQMKTKVDLSTNHVIISLTIQEFVTLLHNCERKILPFLTKLALVVQIHHFAG